MLAPHRGGKPMPEANSTPFLSNQVGRNPAHAPGATPKPKLLDRLREALRSRHYSRRTEQTYCLWVKGFIYFHKVRHPAQMAEKECLFPIENLLIVLLPPLRYQALTHKNYTMVARILFNNQRAIIMGKCKHSIEQSRSIESP